MTTVLDRSDVRIHRWLADGVWSRTVEGVSDAHLAHSPEWCTIIQKAYGHDPLYLSAEDGEGGFGILPSFVVRRPVLGAVVTSMPFLDGGGPCSSSVALSHLLVEHLIAVAGRVGARVVELRCRERLGLASQPMEGKVNLTLSLPEDSGVLWRQIDASLRNQIRKAERSGLSVEFGGAENLGAFYDIFAVRMRDLGSPVHALGFLRAIVDSFGDRARIVLVRKGSTPVGGLVALAFKESLTVPWASCLKDYFSLCPNMLLYWETLRTACAEGFRRFDFGRSSRHSGTYHFKRQWGACEDPLFWYAIPITQRSRQPVSSAMKGAGLLAKVWQRLPVSLTRRLGPPIRKYLTQ